MKEITFAAMCCRLRIASYNLANKKQKFSIMNLQIMCNSTETVFLKTLWIARILWQMVYSHFPIVKKCKVAFLSKVNTNLCGMQWIGITCSPTFLCTGAITPPCMPIFSDAPSAPNAMHFSVQSGVPRVSNAAFVPSRVPSMTTVIVPFHNFINC